MSAIEPARCVKQMATVILNGTLRVTLDTAKILRRLIQQSGFDPGAFYGIPDATHAVLVAQAILLDGVEVEVEVEGWTDDMNSDRWSQIAKDALKCDFLRHGVCGQVDDVDWHFVTMHVRLEP